MRKKIMACLVIFVILWLGYMNRNEIKTAFFPSHLGIVGEAAVVLDESSGELIYSKNADEKLYPASTTKLLTALVVLDKASPDEQVVVGKEVKLQTSGEARAGLFEGQVLTIEELLGAMLLQSGNDAARTLAVYVAEKDKGAGLSPEQGIAYFASLMNKKAVELGARNSQFTNPHGLHDPNHYTTAEDIAKIAMAATENQLLANMVSQPSYSTKTHTYTNRNQLLNPNSDYYYEDATGLKTGFTDQAGYCLVSSAERDGRSVIAVVLHSGKDTVWKDSISLLDYGLQKILGEM